MFSIFKKQEKRDIKMPAHLSRAEQKEIREIIKRAENDDGIPRTAQQSIPFDRMFQDGICRIGNDYYTKTIQFQDINYQLAQQDDKSEIFEEWCSFLNFFDSTVHFELSFMNMVTDMDEFRAGIAIPHMKDEFNGVRDEYSTMLFHQMEAGNNGLTKSKYLTFGIEAESMKAAKPRLIHLETDLLNNFKRLGVVARTLNGKERLALMHQQFHMGDKEKFNFDWKYLTSTGLSVKDFIAPSSFSFPNGKKFQIMKIRSMYMDADKRKQELMEQNRVKDGMMFKLDWDPRIIGNEILPDGTRKTGIGEFIRKTSLDEFPQFFNVLKGEMSLVGTRPPTLDEWAKYSPHHRARMAVKPGITGMWQVSGRSKITDFEQVVALDQKYIDNWSVWLDFKILAKTVQVVAQHDGAV